MDLERVGGAAAVSARGTDPGSPEAAGSARVTPASTIWADASPSPLEAVATLLAGYRGKKGGYLTQSDCVRAILYPIKL